ncbi:MAG: TolC family protein [Candidatus Sumerlaeaceae bacterium]|nr:TolC family protein [Candidatus Sumerlaeaceae bacterium]
MVGPKWTPPPGPVMEEFQAASGGRLTGQPTDPRTWWTVFNDSTLNGLVDKAYTENLDVQAAGMRIVQARAALSINKWALVPLPTASAGITRSKFSQNLSPELTINPPTVPLPIPPAILPSVSYVPYLTVYDMSTAALWEPDIWGKQRRNLRAAKANVDAVTSEYHQALVALSGDVASNYIKYRTLGQQRARLEEDIETLNEVAKAAEERKTQDADSALAQTILKETQAKVPTLEAAQQQTENALCVLLGMPPQDLRCIIAKSSKIPRAPKKVAIGVPADLLRRRPDVMAAGSQVALELEKLGVAKARIYPSLSLFGVVGQRSTASSQIFDNNSWRGAVGGSVDITGLLVYPVTQNLTRAQNARLQEAVFAYQNAVLNAAREVENSAVAFVKTQDQLPLYNKSAESASEAVKSSLAQYKEGKSDFASVIVSCQYLVSQRDLEVQTRGMNSLSLVAMYRALGGGWQTDGCREIASEKTKKELESRTEFKSFDGPTKLRPIGPTAEPPPAKQQ